MDQQMLKAFEEFYRDAPPAQWTGREGDRRKAMLAAFEWGWENPPLRGITPRSNNA